MAEASQRRRQAVHPNDQPERSLCGVVKDGDTGATTVRARPCIPSLEATKNRTDNVATRNATKPVNSERPNFLSLASANVYISPDLGKSSNAVHSSRFF